MSDNGKFDQHCVVELFGHNQLAGRVTEQTIGGASFIRVDVPKTSKREPFTKLYGSGAIYAITPVSEEVAQAMAEGLDEVPIQEWRLKTIDPSRQLPEPDPGEFDHPDWPDADAWDDEDKDDDVVSPNNAKNAKENAAHWARGLLEGEFRIFDTETTGFDAYDEIIQIGIIDEAGEVVFESLIKPTQPILNSQYHGITDDMVKDAPTFPEVYEKIKAALEGKRAIAYNWAYDSRMLDQVCARYNLAQLKFPFYDCAMEMYAQFYGEWNDYHGNYRWRKLRDALSDFGLKHEDFGTKEHDACTDARATLAVIRKMAEWQGDMPF